MSKRLLFAICILGIFSVSCSGKFQDPIVIWTNKSEIVAYVELFNLTSEHAQAVVIYKDNPAEAFPPRKDEAVPDIIIGSWLKNTNTKDNFMPLDYLFDDQLINRTQFYSQLLQYGVIGSQQYLLPVSFNLSTMVFSQENSVTIPDNNRLSIDQIQEIGSAFNKEEDGVYTSMGFAPSWSQDFLYEMAKLNNVNFIEQKRNSNTFSWDDDSLQSTIEYIQNWTSSKNTSTMSETEYQFKYLYNPVLTNVSKSNSLFAFVPSNELFITPNERLEGIYYRWVHKDNKTIVHDDMLSMGLYKHSENLAAAEQFLIWFLNEENQRTILNWYDNMNLYTNSFGIAGGFSSIRSVNERFYPILYPILWGNLPAADTLTVPNRLPSNWDAIKNAIILPYLSDATNTDETEAIESIQDRLSDWYRFSQ